MSLTLQTVPYRLVVRQDTDVEPCRLCCPVCGSDEIRLGATEIEQGHVRTVAFENHAVVAPTERHKLADGSCVKIRMRCQAGHRFEYSYRYSSGRVFLGLKTGLDVEPFPELWRD